MLRPILVMGVSGSGKSTIAQALAERLNVLETNASELRKASAAMSAKGDTNAQTTNAPTVLWQYIDADDFHPPENVAKMRAGIPLNDDDRAPWLARLNAYLINRHSQGQGTVLACSALKARYRDRLNQGLANPGLHIFHAQGSFELIEARMKQRANHYMPSSLLRSQFEALEPAVSSITLDINQSVQALVETAISSIQTSN
jgi:gluconokinase